MIDDAALDNAYGMICKKADVLDLFLEESLNNFCNVMIKYRRKEGNIDVSGALWLLDIEHTAYYRNSVYFKIAKNEYFKIDDDQSMKRLIVKIIFENAKEYSIGIPYENKIIVNRGSSIESFLIESDLRR